METHKIDQTKPLCIDIWDAKQTNIGISYSVSLSSWRRLICNRTDHTSLASVLSHSLYSCWWMICLVSLSAFVQCVSMRSLHSQLFADDGSIRDYLAEHEMSDNTSIKAWPCTINYYWHISFRRHAEPSRAWAFSSYSQPGVRAHINRNINS